MGSEYSRIDQQLSQAIRSGEWNVRNQKGNTIFANNYSGEEFELKRLKVNQEDIKRYTQRQKYSFEHTPKIIIHYEGSSECSLLVQYAPYKVQESLKMRKVSDLELLIELSSILTAVQRLSKKYTCFFITSSMIKTNKNNKIVVWCNQDFYNNDVQFPIPRGQGEETMVTQVLKIYNKYLSREHLIIGNTTLKQTLLRVAEKIDNVRRLMISSNSQMNCHRTVPIYQRSASMVKRNIIPIYDQKTLLHSQSIYRCLQNQGRSILCSSRDSMTNTREKTFSRSHYQNRLPTSNQRVCINPIKDNRFVDNRIGNVHYQSSHMPILIRLDSQKTNRHDNSPEHFTSLRQTNQLDSSYQSMNCDAVPFIKLQPVEDRGPSPMFHDFRPAKLQIASSSSRSHQKGSIKHDTSLDQLDGNTDTQNLNQEQYTPIQDPQDINSFDISINKIKNEDVESDLNGLFQGSAKTIGECSELGSPLKRQLKSDLQRLFI